MTTESVREVSRSVSTTDEGIDFISGLLAKDPEDRLSMPQALAHPWLAAPSSQTNESQVNRLGGDSVWSIESFDPQYSRSEFDDDNDERSRTNFESDGIPSGSDGWEPPMSNLQLHTPARIARVTQSLPSPALTADRSDVKRDNGHLSDMSPQEDGEDLRRPRKSTRIA